MVLLGVCNICHIVAYVRVTRNDLTGYNCSDSIINEIMRKGFEDITTNIIYIKVNFFLDLILFLANCLAMIIGLILEKLNILIPKENEPKDEKMNEKNDDTKEKSEEKPTEIPLNNYYPSPDN